MGHGAARELGGPAEVRVLDPEIASRLTTALEALDAIDPKFKDSRDDERNGQLTKMWMDVNNLLVEHLRLAGNTLIKSHQIALEMGSEGGGQGATPWVEEGAHSFPRMQIKLQDQKITAISDGQIIAQTAVDPNLSYEWVEQTVVKWILASVAKKQAGR